MKKIIWKNPNKMEINTGNKIFDKQCLVLVTDNACTNTQTSSRIRAYNNMDCNGFKFPVGYLRQTDLVPFQKMPDHFRAKVLQATEDSPAILYKFFHTCGGRQIIHGFVLTKINYELIDYCYTNYRAKTMAVIDTALEYISNPEQTA